ncbi:MAG: 3-hydroxyacyl-ACP dehydratase [Chitinophagaceae bacterium]|nr:3-hydroxyacyl-ACP dehydratase [Chitinophagaceae bacterium]
MLKGNFYTLTAQETSGDTVQAVALLNASHSIFDGHFPGQPVVPGVCMLQIVKEMTIDFMGKDLVLRKADTLKFLAVIDPLQTTSVGIQLNFTDREDNTIRVAGFFSNGTTVYFKFKGTFGTPLPT